MRTYHGIAWSPTRGRLLVGCTRRYVLQHVIGQSDYTVRRAGMKRPLKDYARRGLREAIFDLLDYWSLGEERSELESREMVHHSILESIVSGQVLETDAHSQVNSMIDLMMHRLQMIRGAPLIGRLSGKTGTWQSVDRLQPLLLDGARQYGSPDLMIWNGDRLELVRLSMEIRGRVPDDSGVLELGSMLLWAERNPLISVGLEKIDVVRIGWMGTRWVKWSRCGSNLWASESRSLISMDIEQMARLLVFDDDVDELPTSNDDWRCTGCGYKKGCPKFNTVQGIVQD